MNVIYKLNNRIISTLTAKNELYKSMSPILYTPIKFNLHILILLFISLASSLKAQTTKSEIAIKQPTQGTVWSIPDMVNLEWEVENISSEKSTRFFLIRNEMVVQELGSFKNSGFAEGIALAKNIGSGDRYQVVGIELFPEDKFQIAKYVTPFFTIINKASDERKKQREQAKAAENPIKKKTKKQKRKERNSKPVVVESTVVKENPNNKEEEEEQQPKPNTKESKPEPTALREEFEGRKISYTKELEFSSPNISIKIWDHGRQDGDIVSIFLNGAQVVTKHYLTYNKREFKVKLNPAKSNDLFLYAHNLGNSPPNTVSIEISDGTKSENIILNSDLKSCEAVMISVKK